MSGKFTNIAILLLVLTGGAVTRLHRLSEPSLWLDEYWGMHMATGRGGEVLNAPTDVILQNPPQAWFEGAPSWWHIWTGMDFNTHPPFYYFVLRVWVDLFGDSDLSVRLFSVILGLTGLVVLFDIVRHQRGAASALLASGLWAVAVSQIDAAQDARPYTLIALLSLMAIRTMLSIERGQAAGRRTVNSSWNIAAIGILCFLLVMTHYLAIGGIFALIIYAAIRLRAKERRWVLTATAMAGVLFLVAWGPMLFRQRGAFAEYAGWFGRAHSTSSVILWEFLATPAKLLMGHFEQSIILTVLMGIAVFFAPIGKDFLLWRLWSICGLGVIALSDLVAVNHRMPLIAVSRYTYIAAPGVVAILSQLRWKWLAPLLLLAGVHEFLRVLNFGISFVPQHFFAASAVVLMASLFGVYAAREAKGRAVALWTCAAILLVTSAFLLGEYLVQGNLSFYCGAGIVGLILFRTLPSVRTDSCLPIFLLTLIVAICAGDRFTAGKPAIDSDGDTRSLYQALDAAASPHDLIVFKSTNGAKDGEPRFYYLIYQHYAMNHSRPVMFASHHAINVAGYSSVWLVTNAEDDIEKMFPGWVVTQRLHSASIFGAFRLLAPGQAATAPG